MVAGKVKQAMGLQKSSSPSTTTTKKPSPPPKSPSPSPSNTTKPPSSTVFNRVYFNLPRSSAQVQPRPPDVSELLKLIDELRNRESRLKTDLLELKLIRESAAIVPLLERDVSTLSKRVRELEVENAKLIHEREVLKEGFDCKVKEMSHEIEVLKQFSSSQRFQGLIEVSGKSNLIKNLSFRKTGNKLPPSAGEPKAEVEVENEVEIETPVVVETTALSAIVNARSKGPRVPKPPPKRRVLDERETTSVPAPPPPPPPPLQPQKVKSTPPPPPPPPPPPQKQKKVAPPPPPPPPRGVKSTAANVKRVPEVVEFYHSLMRRESRRESGAGAAEITAANARDLVGEIENRSVYLLAIKTDVETQGEFIRFLIKEVETAAFTDIEDVVSFVKWLDDELSFLVDERAVLKHFNWPEQKADALREAAFEYSDLKKLETEASLFRDDPRQPCSLALKKMQTLLEKLEHGVYNLSRLRESATNRFKTFQIPVDWMLDTGFVSQIKLASVKLAMKYMKRVSAELEAVGGGPEEEELIVQGVRFAFRVHQFAGGFDLETMRAFEELRDKASSCRVQCQNHPQRFECRSMSC